MKKGKWFAYWNVKIAQAGGGKWDQGHFFA
jgi:hypothetical protein